MRIAKLRRRDVKHYQCCNHHNHHSKPFMLVDEKIYCTKCYQKLAQAMGWPNPEEFVAEAGPGQVPGLNEKYRKASTRMKRLRREATPAEKEFRHKLWSIAHFQFQRAFVTKTGFVIVDFYLKEHKLAVEIDGGYHNTPEQQRKDTWKENYLKEHGVKTVRFTNEEAFRLSADDIRSRLDLPELQSYEEKVHVTHEGDLCRDCQIPVVKRSPKRFQRTGTNRYAWYLYCPKCKKIYFTQDGLNDRWKPRERKLVEFVTK